MSWYTRIRDVVEKAAPVVIGGAIGSVVPGVGTAIGASIGGAAGSALRGGDLTQIAQGGLYGYGAGTAIGGLSSAYGAYSGAAGLPASSGGIAWDSPLTTAAKTLGGSFTSSLPSALGGSGSNLLSLANLGSTAYSAFAGNAAANKASGQLQAANNQAIGVQNNAIAANNANVTPYMLAGGSAVAAENNLINDPNAQRAFIQNNPFYKAMADDAQNRLFANSAAKGTLGSGGTKAALQNSLLLLGQNLVDNNVSQNQNLAGLGANSASNLNSVNNSATNNLTNLIQQGGSAQAAGTIGGYNAITGSLNNGLKTAATLYGINNGVKI